MDYPVAITEDSERYYIISGDTVFVHLTKKTSLNGDTTGKSWQKFLEKNLNSLVLVENGAPAGLYTVTAHFIVNKDGSVSDLGIDEDAGYGSGSEVLRVMNNLSRWQPAMYHDKPVKSFQKQSITFTVSE